MTVLLFPGEMQRAAYDNGMKVGTVRDAVYRMATEAITRAYKTCPQEPTDIKFMDVPDLVN